jgi:hypothetical protein
VDRAARTRLHDRTAATRELGDKSSGTAQPERTVGIKILDKKEITGRLRDRKGRTGWNKATKKGHCGRIAMQGLSGHDTWDRTIGTRQPRQVGLDKSA